VLASKLPLDHSPFRIRTVSSRRQPPQRRERAAVVLELRLEPTGAEADDGATGSRDLVERRDLLGEQRGIAEEGRRHQRSEPRALGHRRDRRELRPRFENRQGGDRYTVHVVADPEMIEAESIER
jgi:hypothetical protein